MNIYWNNLIGDNMDKNRCYDSDCKDESCCNPEHYNYICFDPDCDEIHCNNSDHFDKKLLKNYQENADFSKYDHREEIDYNEDVDISLCSCSDCDDDHDHDRDHVLAFYIISKILI